MSAGVSNYSSKFCVLSRPQMSCLVQIITCLISTTSLLAHLTIVTSFRRKWKLRKVAVSVEQNLKTCMGYSFSSEKIIHVRHLTKWWCSQEIIRQQAFCWFCLHLNCAPMENIFSLNRDFVRSELKPPSLSLHVFTWGERLRKGLVTYVGKCGSKQSSDDSITPVGEDSSAQTWNTIGYHEDHKSQQRVLAGQRRATRRPAIPARSPRGPRRSQLVCKHIWDPFGTATNTGELCRRLRRVNRWAVTRGICDCKLTDSFPKRLMSQSSHSPTGIGLPPCTTFSHGVFLFFM